MFRAAKEMTGIALEAVDGTIGKLEQFLFDDQNWAIRYLVVDIGSWLSGKRVLLSPAAIEGVRHHELLIKNTKEQIRNSPDINMANPVSRQQEQELHDYYSWPFYWVYPQSYSSLGGALYPGLTQPLAYSSDVERDALTSEALKKEEHFQEQTRQSHLRKTNEVIGYGIQATDELIGHVDDFIIDDEHWVVRYIVIDTSSFLHVKKALIAPQWTKGIDWAEADVYVDFDKETIRKGPEYDPLVPITREFENRLYNYYERNKYWES